MTKRTLLLPDGVIDLPSNVKHFKIYVDDTDYFWRDILDTSEQGVGSSHNFPVWIATDWTSDCIVYGRSRLTWEEVAMNTKTSVRARVKPCPGCGFAHGEPHDVII